MRKILSILLAVALVLGISIPAVAAGIEKRAIASSTKFIMDGKEVTFDSAYLIEDSNYIQLRSVAQMLNGTASQFNVYWDDVLRQAVIETGKPYTGVKPVAEVKSEYGIGDKVIFKNTEITVNKASRTNLEENNYFAVEFTVLTSNPYLRGRSSHGAMDFIKRIETSSGAIYSTFLQQATDTIDIYQNQKATTTLYYTIPHSETIKSIIVSDGVGNIQTISVN